MSDSHFGHSLMAALEVCLRYLDFRFESAMVFNFLPHNVCSSAGPPTIELREAMEGEEGCDVSIVAKISGCPFPTLTWHKASMAKPEEKAAVQYDQHMSKLVTPDKCTLLIQQASRQDSALYSLTATNSLGTASKDIKLSVLGEKYK